MPTQWFDNLATDARSKLLEFAGRALVHYDGNVEFAAQDCQAKFALELTHARFAVRLVAPMQVTTALFSLVVYVYTNISASSR